jgi:hypothetical protein
MPSKPRGWRSEWAPRIDSAFRNVPDCSVPAAIGKHVRRRAGRGLAASRPDASSIVANAINTLGRFSTVNTLFGQGFNSNRLLGIVGVRPARLTGCHAPVLTGPYAGSGPGSRQNEKQGRRRRQTAGDHAEGSKNIVSRPEHPIKIERYFMQ